MGMVLLIWLLQGAAIVYIVLQGVDPGAILARIVRIARSPVIIGLGAGSLAFLLAGSRAMGAGDVTGAGAATISFFIQFVGLIVIFLRELFTGRGGGFDMVFGSAKFATPEHAMRMGLIGETGFRLGSLRNPDPKQRDIEQKQGLVLPPPLYGRAASADGRADPGGQGRVGHHPQPQDLWRFLHRY